MIMKKLILSLMVLLAAASILAQDLTLDQVLEKHFKTIGQDNLTKLQSMKMNGKVFQMGMEFPYTMIMKRPNMVRMDFEVQGKSIVQAYDGQIGWQIIPFSSPDPQDMNPDQLKQMKQNADMDGMLYNWKEKGSKLELIGKEDLEGAPAFNLKLTTIDNDIMNYFIDAENFIILKVKAKVNVEGKTIDSETIFSNYKQLNGMTFPFSMETKAGGVTGMQLTIDTIAFEVPIDLSRFSKPVSAKQ